MKRHLYDEKRRIKCYKTKIDETYKIHKDLAYLPQQLLNNSENLYKLEDFQGVQKNLTKTCKHACKKKPCANEDNSMSKQFSSLTANENELTKYRKFLLETIL